MIYIKNDQHGILQVRALSKTQKTNGWYVYDLENDKKIEVVVEEKPTLDDLLDVEEPEENEVNLNDMSKKQLESYARTFDIELDRRKSKANMLKEFNEQLGD